MKESVIKFVKDKLHKVWHIENFRDLVFGCAERYKKQTAFRLMENGKSVTVSFEDLCRDYRRLCSSFFEKGLEGASIAVMGKNSYAWALTYLAAATVGVAVPIDKELSGEDIDHFLAEARCKAVIGDRKLLDRITKQEGVLYAATDEAQGEEMTVRSLTARGEYYYVSTGKKIDSFPIDREKMSILLFTSGTTGSAKGVCLSQKNICANILSTAQTVKASPSDSVLSLLPLHHTYECTLGFLLILYWGASIAYCSGLMQVAKELTQYSPTVLFVVPAILEFMLKRIKKEVVKGCPERYKSVFSELPLRKALKKVPLPVALIIKKKIRASLGGKLRMFIVGAAAVSAETIEEFYSLGIITLQGYGLTECAPLLAGNSDFIFNPESTGVAIPGVELRILHPNAEGVGEIIARGDNIMLGYYHDDEANRSAFVDGFFRTGDLGRIDENGFLYITGRLKNVIVTSNGKNIYPEELETRISEHDDIEEVLVVPSTDHQGDVCVKAKIFPNRDKIKAVLGHLPSAEEIADLVKKIVDNVNKKLPAYKQIKKVEVLSEKLEKTTTQKIKRFGKNLSDDPDPAAETPAEEAASEQKDVFA